MTNDTSESGHFLIIGENLHTSRVVKRNGIRSSILPDGREVVHYKTEDGKKKYLEVPEHFKNTQPYKQNNIKHFIIAVWKGINGNSLEAEEAADYVQWEALRQIRFGAHFLDLNVDEASHKLEEQKVYIVWMVENIQDIVTVPLSIDSSNPEIIEAGLKAYNGNAGRPLLNSVALERLDTLDMAKYFNARIVATAAAENGMPSNADERVENAGRVIEAALSKGIKKSDIFVDPLFFPISVSPSYGMDALNAISALRKKFGHEIHITGGMSNMSFGLPKRKLINQVFIHLAIEAGADSGIIDPVQCPIKDILGLDMTTNSAGITRRMLEGEDEYCADYIAAYRNNNLV